MRDKYYFYHRSYLRKIIRFLREIECIKFECNKFVLVLVNSLTAIGGPDRQLFFELRARVVSPRIFVRSQSLIARLTRNDFSLLAVSRNFYEALLIDDVSRGSKSYLFRAS